MVTEQPTDSVQTPYVSPERRARQEARRAREIELALAAGDHQAAEWLRQAEFDNEFSEAEARQIVEEIEASKPQKTVTAEESNAEMDALYPEDVVFWNRLYELIPNWDDIHIRSAIGTPEYFAVVEKVAEEFPEASYLFDDDIPS